jgi:predicted unusual protein kinase regulating ubiquinone biosynthesis (AarF/ABC1/UbiB family)
MTQPRGPVPPTYDPERIAAEAEAAGPLYGRRRREFAVALATTLAWVALLFVVRGVPALRLAFARWARRMMLRQGAVFIKFGQMLSTRVDAFSEEVLAELSQLQDKVPPFPFEQVRAIVEADLGAPLATLFARFDPEPLAAASLGQVHAATLPSGEDAVVKVLRPNLAERFAVDLTLMRRCAQWIEAHPRLVLALGGNPTTPYVLLVDRLGRSCYEQLDLWAEGLHGEKFARNFAKVPRVTSPAIYWTHASTRVLAQERIYGYRFDDEKAIRAAGIDYLEMAEIGIRAFTKQIFEDAFFHADTHPGNIFVTPAGDLVYLDFGMVEYIDDKFQQELVEMFIHVVQQDWDAFYEDMVRAGIMPEEVDRERVLPIFREVTAAQLGYSDKRYTLAEVSQKYYAVMRDYPFRLPDRFLFLTRTAASMEGVVYRADPSFKFLPIALPFFSKLVLGRVDVENPWIIQDLLKAAGDGDMVERLAGLVQMAVTDEPEAMASLAESLIDVVAHPQAGPLRTELKEKLLGGGLAGMAGMVPAGLALGAAAGAKLEAFLMTPEGRDYALEVLEDPRFPALTAKLVATKHVHLELPIDWGRVVTAWFSSASERRRAVEILHALMASPDFPWATFVDPAHQLLQLQQLQLSKTVPRAEHLPLLLDALVRPATLPLLAKGVFRGWSQRLGHAVRGTGPLTGPLVEPPPA